MSKKKLSVWVLMGGPSAEHEVSLNTGRQVLQNLDTSKYHAQPVFINRRGHWLLPEKSVKLLGRIRKQSQGLISMSQKEALKIARQVKPHVVFIAMHGSFGEDGKVQAFLETVGLPYTGSGVLASALGMDKPISCSLFRQAGLLVPEFYVVTTRQSSAPIERKLGWPMVVKPANHGSSVGISIVQNKKHLRQAIKEAAQYSQRLILQKFISGRELTCGVLEGSRGRLKVLPPTEIIAKAGNFYDYKSKYNEGGSEHITPPRNMSVKVIKKIQDAACRAHSTLGCSGMSRSDFILGKDGKLYILEINTIPGMTRTSLLPDAARVQGIKFPRLLDLIIKSALRKQKK